MQRGAARRQARQHLPSRAGAGEHRLMNLILGDPGHFSEMDDGHGNVVGRRRLGWIFGERLRAFQHGAELGKNAERHSAPLPRLRHRRSRSRVTAPPGHVRSMLPRTRSARPARLFTHTLPGAPADRTTHLRSCPINVPVGLLALAKPAGQLRVCRGRLGFGPLYSLMRARTACNNSLPATGSPLSNSSRMPASICRGPQAAPGPPSWKGCLQNPAPRSCWH